MQQMRENEMRREAEREIERMWSDVQHKEMQQLVLKLSITVFSLTDWLNFQMEREKQELFNQKRIQRELKETWAQQVQGKMILQEEKERVEKEDQIELDKLREKINNEEMRKVQEKRMQVNARAKELQDQITDQEKFLKQRRNEEQAFDKAMVYLTEQELKREEEKSLKTSFQRKKEDNLYKMYHNQMKLQKQQEEKHLDAMLDQNRKDIERKADDARCKLIEAKQKLLKVLLQQTRIFPNR